MQKLVKISFICVRIKPLFSYQCLCSHLCFETEVNLRGNLEMTHSFNKLLCREAFYGTQVACEQAKSRGKGKRENL